MYNPTKWQQVKDAFRYWFCRHKHTEIRTVRGGSDPNNLKVMGRFKYCLDCRNNISSWLLRRQRNNLEESRDENNTQN